jgi:hypothetical protein
MIDFPMTERLDDSMGTRWLERHRHPAGLNCRHCGSAKRRLFREQRYVPA